MGTGEEKRAMGCYDPDGPEQFRTIAEFLRSEAPALPPDEIAAQVEGVIRAFIMARQQMRSVSSDSGGAPDDA
jgi:hypothetical protein